MRIKIIMLFFTVKEKNWFWPTRQYVIFPVLDVCRSIHNLLLVPSTITWWIYYFTAPETSALPLIQGLDDIPKHETSSCSQGPYIVDEEKGIRDPYIVCVLWMRKRAQVHICFSGVGFRSQTLGKRFKGIVSYVWRNSMQQLSSLTPQHNQRNLPVTKKESTL